MLDQCLLIWVNFFLTYSWNYHRQTPEMLRKLIAYKKATFINDGKFGIIDKCLHTNRDDIGVKGYMFGVGLPAVCKIQRCQELIITNLLKWQRHNTFHCNFCELQTFKNVVYRG